MATKRQTKKQETLKAKAVQAADAVAEIKEATEHKVTEAVKATEEKVVEAAKAVAEKTAEVAEAATEKTVEAAKAVTEKAAEVKKTTTKKAAVKKEIKTTLIVEHQGKQVGEKEMISAVKKAWTKTGKKVGDIKSMTLYAKPEEESVYYVINDTETGKVEF